MFNGCDKDGKIHVIEYFEIISSQVKFSQTVSHRRPMVNHEWLIITMKIKTCDDVTP